MRGGRDGRAQIFCPLFTNCILGEFGDGEEGGRPLPKFFGTLVLKEVVHVVLIRGRGGGVEVIWTKSKRIATFFSGNLP